MSEQQRFLSYMFNGWRFDFHGDYIVAINPVSHDRYRLAMDPYSAVPFQIQLIERGTYSDAEHALTLES
jgi:hypothetical protein